MVFAPFVILLKIANNALGRSISASCNLINTQSGTGRNFVDVVLYSNDFSSSVRKDAQVYVGSQYQTPNIIFNVRDTATNTLISMQGVFHIFDNTTSLDANTTDSIFSKALTYGDMYTLWYEPANYTVAYYSYSSDGINPLSTSYGNYVIPTAGWTGTKYMTAYISKAPAGYHSATFKVIDMAGNPIPNVQVTASSGNISYTDAGGLVSFILPQNQYYEWIFKSGGYQDYNFAYTLTADLYVTVTLNVPAVTATQTIAATTTATTVPPTIGPTPPPGGVTDFWGNIGYWLQLIGIPISQLSLFGAIALIVVMTFGGMFIAGKADQAGLGGLVGAIVGFLGSAMVGWISMAWVAIAMVMCAVFFAAKFWPTGS